MAVKYDCIIIGAAPAGITAGIYAVRQGMKTLIISEDLGGQVAKTTVIENWPGAMVNQGMDLVNTFVEHAKKLKVEFRVGERVDRIEPLQDGFLLHVGGTAYEARSVIIATGRKPRKLGIPGEAEFSGRGVSYCAICDGPLFSNKTVAVIGGGNSALTSAMMLSKHASSIYLVTINPELYGEVDLLKQVKESKKITPLYSTETQAIKGALLVNGITVKNTKTGKSEELAVEGVFVDIGQIPNSAFVKDLVKLSEYGAIIVDEHNETSIPGLFAAGDVTPVITQQIVVAAGEGAKAGLAAYYYVSKKK